MLKKKKLKQNYSIVPINMEMNRVNTEIKKMILIVSTFVGMN